MQVLFEPSFRLTVTGAELSVIGQALAQFVANERNGGAARREATAINERILIDRVHLLGEALEYAQAAQARVSGASE
jgi:hypothetical protein